MHRLVLSFFLSFICFVFAQSGIQYQYDDLNRLERIEYPNGTIIVYTYDEVGNRLTQTISSNAAAPAANFTANPTTGFAPLQVTFTDASVPGANPITSWQWDFNNDGTVDATGKGPHIYTYTASGLYSVKLTVSDGINSGIHVKQNYINVGGPGNQPPIVANPISNQNLFAGGPDFTRDLATPPAVFTDPDGDPLAYSAGSSNEAVATAVISTVGLKINPGKDRQIKTGIPEEGNDNTAPALEFQEKQFIPIENSGSLLIVSPVGEGTATISITANDGRGGTATTTFEVNVGPAQAPPTADFIVDDTYGTAPFAVTFTDASIPGSNPIITWEWDFDFDGTWDATGKGPHTYTFNTPGTYSSRLRVSDGNLSHTLIEQSLIVVVDNQAPLVINPIPNQSFSVGGGDFVLDLEATPAVFSDPDNDPLTYSAVSSNDAIATASMNGSSLTVSPVAEGTATITVEADDGNGGTASTTFMAAVGGVGYSNDFLWAKKAGGDRPDVGYQIATDPNGNVIVSGTFNLHATFDGITINSSEIYNIFIAKYNNAGDVIWAKHITEAGADFRSGLAVDNSGNVYVTGGFRNTANFGNNLTLTSAGDYDIFVAKYDPAGSALWAKRAGSIWPDYGISAAVDPSGNCYITGYFMQTVSFDGFNLISVGGRDIFVAKYNSSGNVSWAKRFGGDGTDEAYAITADAASNVYVTGKFSSSSITFETYSFTNPGGDDVFTVKLNGNGDVAWANHGASSDWVNGYGIDLDGSQNVYVVGGFASAAINFGPIQLTPQDGKVFVVKYGSNGNPLWAVGGGGNSNAIGYGITVNNTGILITGSFDGNSDFGNTDLISAGSHDVFVAGMNESGNFLWALQGGGSGIDRGYDIDSDASSLGLITGYFQNIATFSPFPLTSDGYGDIFLAETDQPIVANHFPVVLNPIPNQNLEVGGNDFVRDLEATPQVFSDPDGDLLTYSAGSGNEAIATANLAGAILTVHPLAQGNTTITLTAGDGHGGTAATGFEVTVTVAPALLDSAVAYENLQFGSGIDADDYVMIIFDRQTNRPTINAANINTILQLSNGHSWLSGDGSLSQAYWVGGGMNALLRPAPIPSEAKPASTSRPLPGNVTGIAGKDAGNDSNHSRLSKGGMKGNFGEGEDPDTLIVQLSTSGGLPSIAVGDMITTDGLTITSVEGGVVSSSITLSGSFDPLPSIQDSVMITPGDPLPVSVGNTNLTFDFSSGPGGKVTVDVYENTPIGLSSAVVNRMWDIVSAMPNGSFTLDLRIAYSDAEILNLNESELAIAYYDPSLPGWIKLNSTEVNPAENYVMGYGLNHFSKFAIGEQGSFIEVGTIGKVSIRATNNDVILIWAPVTGVDSYHIYRDSDPYFTPGATYASSADTFFVDVNAAVVNTTDYFYRVSAVKGSLETGLSEQIGKSDFLLRRGWNLISLPVVMSETAIDSVIGAQLTGGANPSQSDILYHFDGSSYKSAWHHEPSHKWYGTLTKIEPDKGYWVNILSTHSDTLLTFVGTVPDSSRLIAVSQGWNMVGSCYPVTVGLSQSNLAGSGFTGGANPLQSDKIYEYGVSGYTSAWLYAPTLGWYGTLSSLKPGRGYWIYVLPEHLGFNWLYTRQQQTLMPGGTGIVNEEARPVILKPARQKEVQSGKKGMMKSLKAEDRNNAEK